MPRKPKVKTTSVSQGIRPTLKDMSNMDSSSVSNQNLTHLENKGIKESVNKAMSVVAQEGISKIIKGGARLNLLSMMFSPTSAKADPVIDPDTGVNRFTGATEFTPMFKRK